MMTAFAAIAGSASVFLLALYALRARTMQPNEARLHRLRPDRVQVEQGPGGEMLLRRSASSIPAVSRWLSSRGYAERWASDLERAGLRLRPGEYFMMRAFLAVIVGGLIALLGQTGIAFFVAIPAAGIAFQLPAYWLGFRINRRTAKINAQLVETIELIANGVRGGFAFAQAVDMTAQRVGEPIAPELNRMLLDINLGSSTEDALRAMNERIGSEDLDMVVTAILIQRNTGGNLAEVLENVTETMRDRERIHGEIKTLTSSQQLTGWVLCLWPCALALLLVLINPSMMSLLVTTTAGLVLLGLWAVLNIAGIVAIRRILSIDI
jgi:tight adherence protein B